MKKGKAKIEKIDHLGIVAGVIRELRIIETIDKLIGTDDKEIITTGEAVAGMILNGLGFTSRALSLTPQFFETKAVGRLIREKIEPKSLNRFKLGRSLDKIFDYGCEKFFSSISILVCKKENIDTKFSHGDTSSFSLNGEYESDFDSQPVKIVRGYSKDKRSDLKQIILELVNTQDGGMPTLMKTWSGNESDSNILRKRVKAFINEFKHGESPRCFVADSKLYDKKTSSFLKQINFVTRIPSTIKLGRECVEKSLGEEGPWKQINEKNKIKMFPVTHYGIKQRWVVVYSQASHNRAIKSVQNSVDREKESVNKIFSKLKRQKFACKEDANTCLNGIKKKLIYHEIQNININECKVYDKPGRPKKNSSRIEYQIDGTVSSIQSIISKKIEHKSCFVLTTNYSEKQLPTDEVLDAYKGQDCVEKGFAFLKSPDFFVASLFVKNTSRIQGLLTIMTLSLLVYSVAQRRLRKQLKRYGKTVPNQINQPTKRPTMKWIFQTFEGIYFLTTNIANVVEKSIEGLNDYRIGVIKLMGPSVAAVYDII